MTIFSYIIKFKYNNNQFYFDYITNRKSNELHGLSLGKITQELQEDGKTVILTVERLMKNKENYKVTISKVKSLSGLTLEKVTKEFKTEDNETPKVEKLVITGPKNFQIVFSEPIKVAGTVKLRLDGKTAAGVSVKQSETSERVFDATVASNLQDGKTYTVLVTGFEDYAKYKNIDTEIELEYAKVTDAPTVEVVKATQEYVEFKFNRPVKGLKLENFYHTYSAWKPVASYNSVEEMDKHAAKNADVLKPTEARDKVVVRFIRTVDEFVNKNNNNLHPLQVGDVEVSVLGQVGSRKVVDNWGNQLQDTELKVTISADKEAPVVEAVEVTGEKEIEITFSKKVLENRSNYEILSENGSKISGLAFTTSKEGKKVKINVGSPNLVGKTVILNVKDVKDDTINMNKMIGVESFNLTFGDKTFKGIKEAVLKISNVPGQDYYANPTLYVAFSEAVDPESAMNIKNYLFTKDITLEEAKKSFFAVDADTSMFSDTVVQLVMSRETFEKKFGAPAAFYSTGGLFPAQVYISSNLKDLAGNSYNAFAKFVQIKDASTAPAITDNEVKVTDYRTVEFSYDLPVMTKSYEIDKKQFTVAVDNNGDGTVQDSELLVIDSVEFNGSKGVKIQLEDKKYNDFRASADAKKVVVTYTASTDKDKKITNELGTPAADFVATATATPKIIDKLAPAFVQGHVNAVDNVDKVLYKYVGGHEHEIIVYFNEKMDSQTFSIHTFKVTGKDGSEYTPYAWELDSTGKVVTFSFKTTSEATIKTLRQELASSISESANSVNVKFDDAAAMNYYDYFQIQLQDHNSAKDEEGNQFGSTKLYPVYHTKAMAQQFIDNSADLDSLAMALKIKLNGNDVTSQTVQKTAAEIAGGVPFTTEVANGFTPVSYAWKVDSTALGTAANQNVTQTGVVSVTVTATKGTKTYTSTAKVTLATRLEDLTVELGVDVKEDSVNVGKVKVTNPANAGGNFKEVLIVGEVNYTAETTAETAAAAGVEYARNNYYQAKKGDTITVVKYENKVGGKVVAVGKVVVAENNVVMFPDALTGSDYVTAPKEGSKKIALKKGTPGLLDGDKVEITYDGKALGEVMVGSGDAVYNLTDAQTLEQGKEIKVKITRNGVVSKLSDAVAVVADNGQFTVSAEPTNIKKEDGTFKPGDVETFNFELTVTNAQLKSGLTTADVLLVATVKDDTNKGTLAYAIKEVQKVAGQEKITVVVEKSGAPSADLAQGVEFKFTVKGTARLDSTKDMAPVAETIAHQ